MKRTTNSASVPFAAIAVALWLPVIAMGDSTFNLQINKRAPNRPVARVKLTLELSLAPTAGVTSVSIGGGTAVTMPAVGTNSGVTAAGDFLTFGKGTGNSVVIDYTPLSNYAAPSNLCVLKVGSICDSAGDGSADDPCDGSQTRSIAFTGPTINAYRLNAYTSASDFTCGSAFKRVTSAAAPTPFAATVDLSATNKGRHTLDLLLVLDRSGSMDDIPAGGTLSRWNLLRNSITTLIDRWDVIEAPLFPGGEWSGDRIATVLFHTTASNATAPVFKARADWNDVKTALPLTTANRTALGAGMNLNITNWFPLATPKNDAVMVIMTDGIQNENPKVLTDFTLAKTAAPGDPPVALTSYQIPMHTIAFGTAATTEAELLDGIAQRTAGLSRETIDPMGLSDSFADILVQTLKGNTISLAHRERGTLTPPFGPLIPVVVDQSVQRAVFSVEWLVPRPGLDIQAFPPGMTPSSTSTGESADARRDAAQSTVVSFDITPARVGTWQIRVVPRDVVEFSSAAAIPYNLSAHFLEHRLSYTIDFTEANQGTGDRLNVRAEVAYDGLPLANLPANAITVAIQRPGDSLGTILHDTDVPGSVLTPNPAAPDPKTAYQQKIAHLDQNGQLGNRINPTPASTISLTQTADGVYTGSFSNTSVQGLYRFDTVLDWNDARTGRVHRAERLQREVRVKPDEKSTDITTVNQGAGTFTITVVPRDRFGNYVGPGHADFVKAVLKSSGALVPGPPADPDQKGRYVFTITGVPPGQSPDVDVTYDAVPVGSSRNGGGVWRFFVDIGPNFPHGSFSNGTDGKWSIDAGIERFVTADWSVEAILGYHRFDSVSISNPHIWQLSVGGKRYFGMAPWHPFIDASVGGYRFDPGNSTKFGANAGGGVLYDVSSMWGIEGVYQYHTVNTSGSTTNFSTLQAGLRVRF